METLRREFHLTDTKSPSPEMFSFPGTPTDNEGDNDNNSEFEFGSCVTPSSPVTPDDKAMNSASPADQFFLNGRLLPHDFPTVPSSSRASFSGTATPAVSGGGAVVNLSRGTSIGSNMSIMSSRSNSSNSRGSSTCSTCSNARTEVSERKTFHQKSRMVHMKGYCRTASVRDQRNVSGSSSRLGKYYNNGSTSSMSTSSGSSKRWQFITPAPVLGPSLSRRSVGSNTSPRKNNGSAGSGGSSNNGSNNSNSNGNGNSNGNSNNNNSGGFLYKVLRSFVATCKACHAMEGKDNEFDLNEGSVVR